MSTPYRSLPGPAREEFIAFTVKDAVNFPLEYTDAMTHMGREISENLRCPNHTTGDREGRRWNLLKQTNDRVNDIENSFAQKPCPKK